MEELLKEYKNNYISATELALNTVQNIEFPLCRCAPLMSKKEFITLIQKLLNKIRKLSSKNTVTNDTVILTTLILDALTMILKYKHYYSEYDNNNWFIVNWYKEVQNEILKHVNYTHKEYIDLMAKYVARIDEYPQHVDLKQQLLEHSAKKNHFEMCEPTNNNNRKRSPLKDNVIIEPPKKRNAFDILMKRSICK